jgi:galactose mutarotase-like enzyme
MMSSITQQHEPFLTYRLIDSTTPSQLAVVPERGGIITQWQVRGQELLYLDSERFLDPTLSVRGGIPILFPICGNLPDGTYVYAGQTYSLKQHGFARDLPWRVLATATEPQVSITLGLESNPETQERYPFEFDLELTYVLEGQSLLVQQRYHNRSSQPMPFSVGFHPYFAVSDKSQLRVDIPASQAIDQPTQSRLPFLNTFDFERPEIDWAFPHLSRSGAIVSDLQRHLRLTMQFSPMFSTLVFWTLKDKAFYCLEPWSGPRNAMNTGDHLLHLSLGETLDAMVRLTVDFV